MPAAGAWGRACWPGYWVMAEVTLFVGPTAHGIVPKLLADDGLAWRPPAGRGDIDRLVGEQATPGVVVLCDGSFEATPAVSHAELCRAIDAGWQVWGVSSLGAIRAHELRGEGMQGFGYVYAQFSRYNDFTDDELCLLHLPGAPYEPVTEALVNLRYALESQGAELGMPVSSQRAVVTELQGLWFGDRTVERIQQALVGTGGLPAGKAERLLAWLGAHRIKSIDLVRLLSVQPWAGAPNLESAAPAPAHGPPASPRPRSSVRRTGRRQGPR